MVREVLVVLFFLDRRLAALYNCEDARASWRPQQRKHITEKKISAYLYRVSALSATLVCDCIMIIMNMNCIANCHERSFATVSCVNSFSFVYILFLIGALSFSLSLTTISVAWI